MTSYTPGPWKWEGEDYRGGWGWQLLVGPNGEGILCGEENGHPYSHLKAYMPIEPKYCKTGAFQHRDNAPAVHVQEADARLIAAAPDMLYALMEAVASGLVPKTSASEGGASKYARQVLAADNIRAAIAKAIGESNES